MMYVKMEKEKFDALINQFPELLEDGWRLPEEGRVCKDICSEEDYLICEYTGNEVDKVLLFICKKSFKNPDEYPVTMSPTAAETWEIETDKGKAVCIHFKNMLSKQGIYLEIFFKENEGVK